MRKHEGLSATTLGGKWGCFTGFLAGFPVFGASIFLAFYGDCFEQCNRGNGLRYLSVIVITLAVAIPVGLLTRNLVNRRTRDGRAAWR